MNSTSNELTMLAWEKKAIRDEIDMLSGGSFLLGVKPDPEFRKQLEAWPVERWREYFSAKSDGDCCSECGKPYQEDE